MKILHKNLLTIVSIKAGPYKFVILSDLVYNSPKTADTVLHYLETKQNTLDFVRSNF